jgi:hypothetical protein
MILEFGGFEWWSEGKGRTLTVDLVFRRRPCEVSLPTNPFVIQATLVQVSNSFSSQLPNSIYLVQHKVAAINVLFPIPKKIKSRNLNFYSPHDLSRTSYLQEIVSYKSTSLSFHNLARIITSFGITTMELWKLSSKVASEARLLTQVEFFLALASTLQFLCRSRVVGWFLAVEGIVVVEISPP